MFPFIFHSFSTGHVDPGETEFTTALRETEEEAGLKADQMTIIKDFEKNVYYEANGKPKRVVYWLAELNNLDTPVVLSEEHKDYKWCEIEEACKLSNFTEMDNLLKEAHAFLTRKNNI